VVVLLRTVTATECRYVRKESGRRSVTKILFMNLYSPLEQKHKNVYNKKINKELLINYFNIYLFGLGIRYVSFLNCFRNNILCYFGNWYVLF